MVKEIDILNTYVLHLGLDDDNVDRGKESKSERYRKDPQGQ